MERLRERWVSFRITDEFRTPKPSKKRRKEEVWQQWNRKQSGQQSGFWHFDYVAYSLLFRCDSFSSFILSISFLSLVFYSKKCMINIIRKNGRKVGTPWRASDQQRPLLHIIPLFLFLTYCLNLAKIPEIIFKKIFPSDFFFKIITSTLVKRGQVADWKWREKKGDYRNKTNISHQCSTKKESKKQKIKIWEKKKQRERTERSSWRILGFNQTIINHTGLIINHRVECLHFSGLSV